MQDGTKVVLGEGLSKRQLLEQIYASMKTERSTYESQYQELAAQLAPTRYRTDPYASHRGGRKDQAILDASARLALRTLKFGCHAGMSSPARPWFNLTTPDPDLAEQPDVKAWLHLVTNRMRTVFLRSNLYNILPEMYGDLAVFSTSASGVFEDDDDMLRVYNYPVGSYCIALDERLHPAVFAREFRYTVHQLIKQFGGPMGQPLQPNEPIQWRNFSTTVRNLYEKGSTQERVIVCWYVAPNDGYRQHALYAKDRMPFKSCYFEYGRNELDFEGKEGFLRESGFRTFPVLAPRWEVVGEDTYGSDCPGMVAIGDVKGLQFQEKKKARALDKGVDPPLMATPNLQNQKVSLISGDLTFVEGQDVHKGLAPIHEVRLEGMQHIVLDMADRRARIREIFYADLFLMLATQDALGMPNPQKTAREIEERHEEKLLALGPVLERFNEELYEPLIDRAFDIMEAAGAIPPAPDALQGMPLKVEFESIMHQAQKLAGIAAQDRFVSSVLNMAQAAAATNRLDIVDEITSKVVWAQIVDGYADKLSADPKFTRSDQEAAALVEQRTQAVRDQAEAERLKTLGQGAQALAKAPINGGSETALDAVLSRAAAGAIA